MDGVAEFITAPLRAAAGWTWEAVSDGITNWVARGFVQLLTFLWSMMDTTSSPRLDAEWFAGSPGAPYLTGVSVASVLLTIVFFCALIHGVMAGQPLELVRRLFRDAPTAVAGILFTAALAHVAVELTDQIADGIWQATRPKAVGALDGLARVAMALPAGSFLAALVLLLGMLALVFLWVVLLVRASLIYVVVALSPLAWAAAVWPALAVVRRRCLELLAGLIVSKVAIALALMVGIGALGGVGATAGPDAGAVTAGLREYSTLMVGLATFGVAGFMPFVVVKLLPVVEGAVVAQGIAGGPVRTAQTGMQYSYYAEGIRRRLSAGGAHGTTSAAGDGSGGGGGGAPPRRAGTSAATAPVGRATGPAAAAGAAVAPVAAGAAARKVADHTGRVAGGSADAGSDQ